MTPTATKTITVVSEKYRLATKQVLTLRLSANKFEYACFQCLKHGLQTSQNIRIFCDL